MREERRLVLFVTVSGFAALVNLLARLAIDRWTSFQVAVIAAFPIGLTVAFLLNRTVVFDGQGAASGQYMKFLLVNLIALAQVFLVSVLLAKSVFPAVGFAWHADMVAHALGLVSPVFTSYWAHKHFTFAVRFRPEREA